MRADGDARAGVAVPVGRGEARAVAPVGRGEARAGAERRLVVGAGCSLGCAPEELAGLVDEALADVDGTVVAVASVDRRAEEPCVIELAARFGVPLRTYAAARLDTVDVPTPSRIVHAHVGTPSVAEAAALLAAGGGLIVPKRRSRHATCAIAEESR